MKGWRKQLLNSMEISADKSKILVNSIRPRPSTNAQMNRKVLEEVDQFKYFGSTQTKDGTSLKEVKIRLLAMESLAVLWKIKADSFPTKIKLHKSLILSILLYGCEWRDESKPFKTNAT